MGRFKAWGDLFRHSQKKSEEAREAHLNPMLLVMREAHAARVVGTDVITIRI